MPGAAVGKFLLQQRQVAFIFMILCYADKQNSMPIYMDIHTVPGVKARAVAEAHRLDMMHQHSFECTCMTYWVDEDRESIFCLIDAPSREAVEELHNKAHGLVPHKVIEVNPGIVSSFLGRIYDPEDASLTDDGLKVFADPSYRVLLMIGMPDPVLLQHELGSEKAGERTASQNAVIRSHIREQGGTEVECDGNCFIISFRSAEKALSCAVNIQQSLEAAGSVHAGIRYAIHGGEPVGKSDALFGDTLQLACYMCMVAGPNRIALSAVVKELLIKDHFQLKEHNLLALSPQDEILLRGLFDQLDKNWQEPEFDIDDYCKAMAMSKSQLYRKAIQLTGYSPNILLKEFRLERAKEQMRKKPYSIAQITFDSGFSSPSYFTKCFKKKFGLLPMTYLEYLH